MEKVIHFLLGNICNIAKPKYMGLTGIKKTKLNNNSNFFE